ncbi:MAG: response regulator transcription factor [Actinobacteria bacterium]|nr:response regulator transcription factor [Actinomycetota bacterium]
MARVLVIDDDRSLLRALRIGLSALGHEVDEASSGSDGLAKSALDSPEVIVLDLGLPDMDGLEVCKRIRQWSTVPVIVLSAGGTEERKVAALDGGADDYMTKPFGMVELEARLRVALRHQGHEALRPSEAEISVGDITIDLVHHEATRGGIRLELTQRELDLLAFLGRHAGKVCTHKMILEEVWGPSYGDEGEYLRVYIYRLRRKLGDPEGRIVRTDPGIGYRLEPGVP